MLFFWLRKCFISILGKQIGMDSRVRTLWKENKNSKDHQNASPWKPGNYRDIIIFYTLPPPPQKKVITEKILLKISLFWRKCWRQQTSFYYYSYLWLIMFSPAARCVEMYCTISSVNFQEPKRKDVSRQVWMLLMCLPTRGICPCRMPRALQLKILAFLCYSDPEAHTQWSVMLAGTHLLFKLSLERLVPPKLSPPRTFSRLFLL